MAITTYAELQTAIAAWSHRDDLTSVIPDFIVMTEALFNHGDEELDFAPLRTWQMETTDDFTVTSGAVALPSDFLEPIRLTAATSPVREIEYAEPGWLKEAYPSGQDADSQRFYTIESGSVISANDFEMVYYQAIPDLATNNSNWLLTAFPNAYLYGGLLQYSIYSKSDVQAQRYLRLMRGAVRGLQRSSINSLGGVLQMRASAPAW